MPSLDNPFAADGLDIEAVRERLRTLQESAQERVESTRRLAQTLETVTGRASDASRVVTVTVDSSGSVVDLQLTERIRGRQPDWLSTTIMDTIKAARANLADQTRAAVEQTIGADSSTGQVVMRRFESGA
ncbi:YbaB/EbfC DNA-binding family protein [Glycomyces sambucus]|uniref:YbaB/EbfC DNA-binding family protein n=1 Tax=Glycomyces sambucus TaxID=380244 RepID=A0A1G9CEJ3_9ACTN|nr:YbaB/EbfC family nucleoid-associated protein [Glycomyces sambucus]SDK50070.1 YbaB/EbfC DNA-binding family protein [Glycomyces sambucus]